MEFITKNAEETKKLGKKLAADLMVNGQGLMAKILALTGELGSGKTTFVQGLAEELGVRQQIISPTFILMRSYPINHQPLAISHLFHLDLYRLEDNVEQEVENLGLEEIWKDPKNIVVIEWAEKIREMVPKEAIWIKFENIGDNIRKIVIS